MQTADASAQSATLRIAAIQFLFTVTWIIYAIYYGDLLAAVGLDRSWVVTIFILDQLVFALMDPLMGAWADWVEAKMRRLAPWVTGLNLLAAAAFVALPLLASHLANLPALLLLATFVWVVSASVLRAPLFVMLDRLPGAPDQTTRIAQAAAGIAVGAALAPFIGLWLKGVSPFIPFLLSSATLAVAGLSLPSIAPRAAQPLAAAVSGTVSGAPRRPIVWLFGLTLLLACGFQFHFFVASAMLYRRFVEAANLPWLLPVFWVGFNLALIPATRWIHRHGAGDVLRLFTLTGSAALLLCLYASSLPLLVAGQCLLGASWGGVFIAGLRAVSLWPTRSGAVTGLSGLGNGWAIGGWFCMLSLATAGRISLDKVFKVDAMTLEATALACWVIAAAVAWVLFARGGDMSLRNSATTYGSLAKLLHWSMALLIIGLIGLGLFMTSEPDGDPKWALYDLHKALGSVVFVLLLVRVVWRKLSPPPGLPASMKPWEQMAAHVGHVLLYVFMLALPVTGYLDSSYGGFHLSIFGLFDVPMLLDKDKALFELYAAAHSYIGYALIAVLLGHIGAALKHHFIVKDDVLRRMTWGR